MQRKVLWVGRTEPRMRLLMRLSAEGIEVLRARSVAMAAVQVRSFAPDVTVVAHDPSDGPLPAQIRTLASRLDGQARLIALADHFYEIVPAIRAGASEVLPGDISNVHLRRRIGAAMRSVHPEEDDFPSGERLAS